MEKGGSLYTTLLRNYILIGVLPLLILGIACQQLISRKLTQEIISKNQILATVVASEIRTFLQEPLSLIYQVKAVLSTNAHLSPDVISPYLNAVLSNHPFFEKIQYLNNAGQVVCVEPLDEASIGTDMSSQSFFLSSQKKGEPHWSQPFVSVQSGAPSLTISISFEDGMVVGYINLTTLSTIVTRMSNEHQFVLITDKEGTIIHELIPEDVQQRINLPGLVSVRQDLRSHTGTSSVTIQDTEMLASVASVTLTGWRLIYLEHHKNAFASVDSINLALVIGILLTVLAALFVAIIGSKCIVRPLNSLLRDVQRVTDGNYSLLNPPIEYRELEKLRESFTSMTKTIMSREQNIINSERQYRNLIEVIPNGIQESNLHGRITFTNSAYDRIFECEKGDAIGRSFWANAMNEEKKQELRSYLAYLIEKQPPPSPFFTKALTDKKNIIDVEVDWQYDRDPEGQLKGFISVITDITKQKKLEENLRQSQKMEALGTLAGGIAHDFNNILSAILGFSQIVLDTLPPGGTAYADQQQIIKASLRAKDLVQHLLLFSRKQKHQKSAVIIGDVVNEAIQLLRASLPTTITFEIALNIKTGIVVADTTQIHQVIINICTNAAHAMETGIGTLSISLDKRRFGVKDQDKPVDLPLGEYACITIGDTGKGIAPRHLLRIYEPFFTTKPTGQGTGMGLAVVHGIVTSHGGAIEVHSVVGHGTTFRLYFPLLNIDAMAEPEPESIPSGNNEHILIVDDEPAISLFTSTILERNGYTTIAVTDSLEALEMFKQDPDAFDLLITDQTMPAMTGFELAKTVLAIRPDLPILLCTGFSSVVSGEKAFQAGISDFIMKPITKQVLYQKVAFLLKKNQKKLE